ncbi:MAG: UvrD-helicase domain-containing protein [Planctomycetia bacterium]|nr:UvrD-helicase domain-containing protein [Planctomycetia bacterium]
MSGFNNIVIRASAGSGKTFQLSNRYIQLLLAGVSPEKILASTFTRKAAGEIRDRILRRLALAALNDSGCRKLSGELGLPRELTRDEVRRSLTKLVTHLHEMRVSTLDSLFVKLAKSFALELKLPISWTIAESTEDNRLLLNAIRIAIGNTSTNVALRLMDLLFKGELQRSIADQIFSTTKNFLDLLAESEPGAWSFPGRCKLKSESEIDDLLDDLIHADLPETKTGKPNGFFVKAVEAAIRDFRQENWRAFVSSKFVEAALYPDVPYRKTNMADYPGLHGALLALVTEVRARILNDLTNKLDVTHLVTQLVAQEFYQLKREQAAYLFSDITKFLSEIDWTHRRRQMISRLGADPDHILLDEFQDTSTSQWHILHPLAESVAREGKKSLFCVGDTKQAIYGWRGGNVRLFDLVTNLPDMKQASLPANRRSSRAVIDVVNKVFADLESNPALEQNPADATELVKQKRRTFVNAAKEWSAAFDWHTTAGPRGEQAGLVSLEESPLFDKEHLENLYNVLAEINELVPGDGRRSAQAVFDSGLGEGDFENEDDEDEADDSGSGAIKPDQKACTLAWTVKRVLEERKKHPGCEIGILTRTNRFAAQLIALFKHYGVEVSGESGVPLGGSSPVEAVLALLRIADHPGDTIAWFQLVHLAPLARELKLTPLTHDEKDAAKFLIDPQQARAISHRIRDRIASRSLGVVVGEFVQLLAGYCNPGDQERLFKLREYACSWTGETNRLNSFIDNARNHRVFLQSDSRIRVMSLHASKGLEFDITVLPELHKPLSGYTDKKIVQRNTTTQKIEKVLLWSPKEYWNILPESCRAMYCTFWNEQFKESLCQLYVGMTRAARELIVVVPPGVTSLSLGGILRGALAAGVRPGLPEGQVLFTHGDPDWKAASDDAVVTLPAREVVTVPARKQLRVSMSPPLAVTAPPSFHEEYSWSNQSRYLQGRVLHRCFEETRWLDREGVPTREYLRPLLAEMVYDKSQSERLLDVFHKMCRKEVIRRALSYASYANLGTLPFVPLGGSGPTFCELSCERPYATCGAEGFISRGVIDRLVLLRDERRVRGADIIDYKSDHLLTGPDGEIDLRANRDRIEQYIRQVENYRYLVCRWYRLPLDAVSCRLLFISHETILDVSRQERLPWNLDAVVQEN